MKVYLKEKILDRFPFCNSKKIQPVILVADEGSVFIRFLVGKSTNRNKIQKYQVLGSF